MIQMFSKLIKHIKQKRGYLQNNLDKCLYCGKCEKRCRAKAITVDRKDRTWKCDNDKCHRCGHCIYECPVKSLGFVEKLDSASI